MPERDLRSNLAVDLAFYAAISGDTTTNGQVLDTAHYDGGIMFAFAAPVYATGTFTPLLEESSSPSGPWTTIPDTRLIGTTVDAAITAQTSVGDQLNTIGLKWLVGDSRYVRVNIVSTGTASGTIVVDTIKNPEIKPVP